MFAFLLCSERSGSNFVTSLVGGHPSISAPPPTHLFRLFASNESNYGDLSVDSNWKALVGDVVDGFDAKLGIWNTTVTSDELLDVGTRKASELLRRIYTSEARHEGAVVSFIKENQTATFVAYLLDSFPDARFVHMLRDPRDVASSWIRTGSIPGGVERAVDTWLADQVRILQLPTKLRAGRRFLTIRYEDLIADPVAVLTPVVEFLGLEYDAATLSFYQQPRTIANAARIEAWSNLKRPIMRGNSGGYRDALTATEIRYVELRCKELMRRFGYGVDLVDVEAVANPAEIETLRREIRPGSHLVADLREHEIRQKRLSVIKRVLERNLR